jgi:hypothetical protein
MLIIYYKSSKKTTWRSAPEILNAVINIKKNQISHMNPLHENLELELYKNNSQTSLIQFKHDEIILLY